MGQKDRSRMVVRGFELRGPPTTTRLGFVVVRLEGSCLGVLRDMGIDNRRYGCGNWGKNGHIDQKEGDLVVQRHGSPE